MTTLTCTNWAFARNEKHILAMFQINDNYLVRYDDEEGFYIPEGEVGANLQGWSAAKNWANLQQEFETANNARDVAEECDLQLLVNEIEKFVADEDYEFSLAVDPVVSRLCEINLAREQRRQKTGRRATTR